MAPLRHDQFINDLKRLAQKYPQYKDILMQLLLQVQQRNIDMEQERD